MVCASNHYCIEYAFLVKYRLIFVIWGDQMDQYRFRDDHTGHLGLAAVLFGVIFMGWTIISGEAGHNDRKFMARQALEVRLEYGNTQR